MKILVSVLFEKTPSFGWARLLADLHAGITYNLGKKRRFACWAAFRFQVYKLRHAAPEIILFLATATQSSRHRNTDSRPCTEITAYPRARSSNKSVPRWASESSTASSPPITFKCSSKSRPRLPSAPSRAASKADRHAKSSRNFSKSANAIGGGASGRGAISQPPAAISSTQSSLTISTTISKHYQAPTIRHDPTGVSRFVIQ